ncbi:MAG: carboxymuconolactone decarboxylase family protein [Hyphococcus sp.]
MSINALREQIPDYAKDIRLNLGTLASETTLSDQQKWGAFYASALATGQRDVIGAVEAEVADKLSDEAKTAAKSAAAIMAMNNVYYRATHLMSASEYQTLPAKLRMNVIGNPGVDKVDFELWSLAVSAINGCGMCLDAHEKVVRKGGLTTEQVQTALRIAAVVNAAASVVRANES